MAFYRGTGIFLDTAFDMAGTQIYDNGDGYTFRCLSRIFITAKCEHKTKSSLWVCDSTSFDSIDASGNESENERVEDRLQPDIHSPDRELFIHIRIYDWLRGDAYYFAGVCFIS